MTRVERLRGDENICGSLLFLLEPTQYTRCLMFIFIKDYPTFVI